MSTMKYKVKDRYSLGWTDPRSISGGRFYSIFDATADKNNDLEVTDTSVLRNLWLATFGDVPVSHGAMAEHWTNDDGIFWVGHELHRRYQVQAVELRFPDRDEKFHGYQLVKAE